MGPNYTSQIVGSAYHFCKLAKECWCCEIEK